MSTGMNINNVAFRRDTVELARNRTRACAHVELVNYVSGVGFVGSPLENSIVTDVRGDGIEDWKTRDGKLVVNFSSRVLGERKLEVQLEQAEKTFPNQVAVAPLKVGGATKQSAQIGAASAPGIRLKTAELIGLREISVANLANRSDELLAYVADQPDWALKLSSEKLAPRIVADVFNLVTVGDGLLGGSATIRYVIINQGVQEFRVKLPAHWKNIEFGKDLDLDFNRMGPVARYATQLSLPSPIGAASLYHPILRVQPQFNRFFVYYAASDRLAEVTGLIPDACVDDSGHLVNLDVGGIIVSDGSATHALGVYGSDVNFPVPFSENNNPNFTGCTNRAP